jgi:hypothetical protein
VCFAARGEVDLCGDAFDFCGFGLGFSVFSIVFEDFSVVFIVVLKCFCSFAVSKR